MDENKRLTPLFVPQMASRRQPVNGKAGGQLKRVQNVQPAEAPRSASLDIGAEAIHGTGAWHAGALDIARGASRYLRALGCAVVAEIPLADGRRADLMALDAKGSITILEVKSCLNDFRTDCKWEDYRRWCDRFYFAVDCDFPQEHIPGDCGLIVADRFDAEALREPAEHRLDAARRKAVTLRFARCAAFRLHGVDDPDIWVA
jgi:hypothetical protein